MSRNLTLSTKHRPRRSDPDLDERKVELPKGLDHNPNDGGNLSLGQREPEEGRYTTVSRLNYLHGKQAPKAGESKVASVRPHDEISKENAHRKHFMQTKNFRLDAEGNKLPLISENRGAQQSTADLVRSEHEIRAHSHTPSRMNLTPTCTTPFDVESAENLTLKSHMERMRSSHVFAGPIETEVAKGTRDINSTQRASYHRVPESELTEGREAVGKLRAIQGRTSWTTGFESSKNWKSEKETKINGAFTERPELSTSALKTWVNVGSSDVQTKDTYRSLKAIDYQPARNQSVTPPCISSHEHVIVLGYRPPEVKSTQRTSYSAINFLPAATTSTATGAPLRKP